MNVLASRVLSNHLNIHNAILKIALKDCRSFVRVAQVSALWFNYTSCGSPAVALGFIGRDACPKRWVQNQEANHGAARQSTVSIYRRAHKRTHSGHRRKTSKDKISRMAPAQMYMTIAHHAGHVTINNVQ